MAGRVICTLEASTKDRSRAATFSAWFTHCPGASFDVSTSATQSHCQKLFQCRESDVKPPVVAGYPGRG